MGKTHLADPWEQPEETRQIQLTNRIKLGSCFFGPSNMNTYNIFIQNSFLIDKYEITTFYITIRINVIWPLVDVND